jgi:hypothetical protein
LDCLAKIVRPEIHAVDQFRTKGGPPVKARPKRTIDRLLRWFAGQAQLPGHSEVAQLSIGAGAGGTAVGERSPCPQSLLNSGEINRDVQRDRRLIENA